MLRNLLLGGLLTLLPPFVSAAPVHPAQLLASYWLNDSAGLDISGLSFCNGELLAVSDKNSADIYALDLAGQGAALVSRTRLQGLNVPDGESAGPMAALLDLVRDGQAMDFEGISCDGDTAYLLSERYNRLARLEANGSVAWLPYRWAAEARERGYLQKANAAGEGLVKAGDDFWIAMEREPRGLVRLRADTAPAIFSIPPVAGLDFRDRSEDITGLAYYDGALFTLERNAFAVCRRSPETLRAQWCIDYRAIEEAPKFVYRETRYGKGEGLAVDASGIHVVLDNNNVARAADPNDRRALLLHFRFPLGTPSSGAPAASSASGP
ncbi:MULTISPECIES: esterase-like activity of phytase family protein [unclassified Microbulbifer]|uniref:esterase-like activity of phytase family protein n=1 Tax=unclassified Microbulbifer TaxID=2619833 RepID=UPI0027E3B711|nr:MULTISPECIES: esterase-like activity of phytase family protein [unclassified Microbulbifer]